MSVYEESNNMTFRITEENERELLANFTARIVKETRLVDGDDFETFLTIEGLTNNPEKKGMPIVLPPVEVPAAAYAGMGWVMNAWGVRAIIQPGTGVKEDLRTAIQQSSRPAIKTIYKSMGWATIDKQRAYLHAGGAITSKGNDPNVTIRLPYELQKYTLSAANLKFGKDAFIASLNLTTLCPPKVAWTLWAATYCPLFGQVDFATHVTGRSGTFKSELTSLFQSHYGQAMDARHLPGSWSSTPNALEALAYYAQNAIFAIDDFVPVGTAYQIRAYQTGADRLIRGQGNQAGRARLTDSSGMQTTFFPRGLIMSSGEDTPEGHSVRARCMISELSPGDIEPKALSAAQKARPLYVTATADMIVHLCQEWHEITDYANELRDKYIKIGHTRTPTMIGRLIAAAYAVLCHGLKREYIDKKQYDKLVGTMRDSILSAGEGQSQYLENADPVQIFLNAFRQALAANQCHLRTLNGAIPLDCTSLGWTVMKASGQVDTYKSNGPCIGWIDWNADELYLDAEAGYSIVKKMAGQELPLTKQTVWKRLKDAGLLLRTDDARSRNTVRVTAEHHSRTVAAMRASEALDKGEKPQDESID
jgi:hypothetical protein